MADAASVKHHIYEMLMESQYWPPATMLAYQRSQLAQLLRLAKATVPFYKTRLDPIFKSNGDIDWDRWHEIPFVARNNLVKDRESMLATKMLDGHGAVRDVFSSGSSGTPITTRHNALESCVSQAVVYRAQRWHGMDWSASSVIWFGNDNQKAAWPEGSQMNSWAPDWLAASQRGKNFAINRATPEENVLEFILRKGARYLSGRPKSLQSIALAAERLNISINLDVVTTFSTGVTDDEREDFRRIFNARPVSLYSSGEGSKMAISCHTGTHYHINSELNYLEILDDEGNPCEIGQPGRVIITPIYNTAQPLIRYEQGDIAIRGPACSCGNQLPVLQEVSGRITHLFRFPDGKKIAPSLPDQEFNEGFGSKTWQLVQTGPLTVELRYLQTDLGRAPDRNFAVGMIRKRLNDNLEIKFVLLQEIPLTNAGKFIQYKSEIPIDN